MWRSRGISSFHDKGTYEVKTLMQQGGKAVQRGHLNQLAPARMCTHTGVL